MYHEIMNCQSLIFKKQFDEKWKRKVNSDFEGSIVINAVTNNGLLRPIKSVLLDAPKSESFKEKE